MPSLVDEEKELMNLLRGKVITLVKRRRPGELLIEFSDGTRLFVDHKAEGLELSVTQGTAPSLSDLGGR